MRGSHGMVLLSLAAVAVTGCQSGPSKQSLATAEPALSTPVEGGTAVAVAPAPRGASIVDRHPLLYKPREYYESSGNNKVVKSAAAVVVGVPAGIIGELRQIVVGTPPEPRY